MGIQKIIINIVLTIESLFLSFFQIHHRVTFISLELTELTSDFKKIYEQLEKEDIDIRLCLTHYDKGLKGQFLYFLNCFKQLYFVYTSKVIVLNDNNYVVSHFKRKNTQVIQVWHACGAIKKFGNAIDRKYVIANYDYVLSTSSYWKEAYSEAFDVTKEHVLPLGMPRCDELFNDVYKKESLQYLYHKYPVLKDKKIILYAPTFRGNIYKGFHSIDFDAQKLLKQLGDDYILIYKFHPLLKTYPLSPTDRILDMNNEDTHVLMCICDYLVSDYSSIIFDYLILEKPFLFYVPDLKEYIKGLGVFVDIEKWNVPICSSIDELISSIQLDDFDKTTLIHLKNQFFDKQDDQSASRVAQLIKEII